MKIVADSNLQGVETLFSEFGDLILLPGREINSLAVKDADALLVRSVTAVDKGLLEKSNIRFVGSATSGTEHVDKKYLDNHLIGFADAKGANAQAVVDFCLSAMAHAENCATSRFDFDQSQVGIVGLGCVGGLLVEKLRSLGVPVLACDPLLDSSKVEFFESIGVEFCPLDRIFDADLVSIHVPYTQEGHFPTNQFIGQEQLLRLPSGAVFINTCRGDVIREDALLEVKTSNPTLYLCIDVWRNEPAINQHLLAMVDLGTPHIAGYSAIAKASSSLAIYEKFLAYFSEEISIDNGLAENWLSAANFAEALEVSNGATLANVLRAALPIRLWSDEFKSISGSSELVAKFDQLRRNQINRKQFANLSVQTTTLPKTLSSRLHSIGFVCN